MSNTIITIVLIVSTFTLISFIMYLVYREKQAQYKYISFIWSVDRNIKYQQKFKKWKEGALYGYKENIREQEGTMENSKKGATEIVCKYSKDNKLQSVQTADKRYECLNLGLHIGLDERICQRLVNS